jgi:hypothetical protein
MEILNILTISCLYSNALKSGGSGSAREVPSCGSEGHANHGDLVPFAPEVAKEVTNLAPSQSCQGLWEGT